MFFTSHLVAWIVVAVLLFWAVGAYNRLMRLRNALVSAFAPVDEQFRHRHALLMRQADALASAAGPGPGATEPTDPPPPDPLRAACLQAEHACQHARAQPVSVGAITSLRLAEEILAEARARVAPDWSATPELAALSGELAAGDTTFAFARRQFNEAVQAYNQAVMQFPTRILSGLFGFRRAGVL